MTLFKPKKCIEPCTERQAMIRFETNTHITSSAVTTSTLRKNATTNVSNTANTTQTHTRQEAQHKQPHAATRLNSTTTHTHFSIQTHICICQKLSCIKTSLNEIESNRAQLLVVEVEIIPAITSWRDCAKQPTLPQTTCGRAAISFPKGQGVCSFQGPSL